ncbi:MAG: hypothetical protein ABI220_04465 [Candidatus Saccharimonadales bacterium]
MTKNKELLQVRRLRRTAKYKGWFKRYIFAEILGTLVALGFAWVSYVLYHSYLAAAAAGFIGEGIGFYGYFITSEIWQQKLATSSLPLRKRISAIISRSGTNLFIEFAPAEAIDNIFIRPAAMFIVPQYIHPYGLGFIVGKLAADVVFYFFAIIGLELKRRWQDKTKTPT